MNFGAADSLQALGTTVRVLVTDGAVSAAAHEILRQEVEAIDLACSRFRADSDLACVNAAGGRTVAVSPLFLEAVEVGIRVARATGGLVDLTVGAALNSLGYDRDIEEVRRRRWARAGEGAVAAPGWRTVAVDRDAGEVRVAPGVELDLGASAKALAADRTASRIVRELGGGVLVNLGGDLAIAGFEPAAGWVVRVADDHEARPSAPGQSIRVRGGGLATSSTTVRRWNGAAGEVHHIVDPRTGESAKEVWRTVSVAAGSCVDANAASTAAIIEGESAPAWLERLGLPSRLVSVEDDVVALCGWPSEVAT